MSAMDFTINTRVRLNNGVEMPMLGLGVFQAPPGRRTRDAVGYALEVGYRHFDTARIYGNEADVGEAFRASGLPMEGVFITTKVWNSDQGYGSTMKACEASLERLGLPNVDLYLIHWPVQGLRGETWRALVDLQRKGKCRAVGVSNYTVAHLEELLQTSAVVPAVNQVEFSPFLYQRDLLEFCRRQGIQLEAYSPLTKGHRLRHPTLVEVAARHGRTAAQILIRWALQLGLVAIPKAVKREHIRENAQVFDFSLSPADMQVLGGLHEGLRTSWDPTEAP